MKWGLGEPYDKVTVLSKKSRAYLDLTKPASSLGVAGAFLMASLLYYYYAGQINLIQEEIWKLVYVVVTVALAHGASQAMNMAEDAEMDRNTPHKQNRPIPAGIVTEEEARTLAWFLMIFALGRAYTVNYRFGVMISILVFFGIFYNLSPIRAKERLVSIPWQAVSRGFLMFPTVWAAHGSLLDPTPWVLGVFMFLYVLGFQSTADLVDAPVDEEYGIQTFVVAYGIDKTVQIGAISLFAMLLTLMVGYALELLPATFLASGVIVPLCGFMIYSMETKTDLVSPKTGNHPSWLWYYAGMVLVVAAPLAAEVAVETLM